jgi:hypothetical protein
LPIIDRTEILPARVADWFLNSCVGIQRKKAGDTWVTSQFFLNTHAFPDVHIAGFMPGCQA